MLVTLALETLVDYAPCGAVVFLIVAEEGQILS